MTKPYIIGVCGGTASGKTYLIERLQQQLNAEIATFISMDNFYRPREEQPIDENNIVNYDTPNSIDWKSFHAALTELRSGKSVRIKKYGFNNPLAKEEWITWNPAPVWIIEGLFCLHDADLRNAFDMTLFIDPEEHVKVFRRIERDHAERGYDLKDVAYRYLHHVMPAYRQYVQPYRAKAHIIIPNNEDLSPVVEMWALFIKEKAKLLQ